MRLSITKFLSGLQRKSWLGQAIVVLIGVQILFFGSFAAVSLPTATGKNLQSYIYNRTLVAVYALPKKWQDLAIAKLPCLSKPVQEVRFSYYVPLLPLSVFVGYIEGSLAGLVSALLFCLLGLIGPAIDIFPFAEGAGWSYFNQPSFGYLIGLPVASWFAGRATNKRRTTFRQAIAVLGGVFAGHLVGLAYLLASFLWPNSALIGAEWRPWIFEEVRNLTWHPLPYDLLFSFFLIGLGSPFRWLMQTLIAPDLGLKGKPQKRLEDLS